MRKTAFLTAAIVLFWSGLAIGQNAPTSRAQDDEAELIRKLDADSWKDREEAQKALTRRGASASAALKAAVASGKLSMEGRTRAEWILSQVDVPEYGAVWRDGLASRPFEEIQDGDVIVRCGEHPIESSADLRKAVQSGAAATLVVWRRGRGAVTLETGPINPRMPTPFQSWPDPLELFDRFAKGDRFDEQVRQAIRSHLSGDPNSQELFAQAWGDGCRSLMIATVWLRELREAGKLDQARKLWRERIQGVAESYPGGLWQYGLVPVERATVEIAGGNLKGATAILDEAASAATKADAFLAIPALRRMQAGIKIACEPKEESLRFWREHASEIMRPGNPYRSDAPVEMANRLAAEADPAPALDFANGLPPSLTRTLLVDYYTTQVERAKISSAARSEKPHWVLTKWLPVADPGNPPLGEFAQHGISRTPGPVRVETQMRVVSFPPERTEWMRVANLQVYGIASQGSGNAGGGAMFRLYSEGRLAFEPSGEDAGMRVYTGTLVDPNAWLDVALEVHPDRARAQVAGRPAYSFYPKSAGTGLLRVMASSSGLRAAYRDVRVYTSTAAKVDNDLIQKQMQLFLEARRASDLDKGREAAGKAIAELEKAPEGAALANDLRRDLRQFEQFLSPSGLNLCTAESLSYAVDPGVWEFRDGALIARVRPGLWVIMVFPLGYRSFELRGLVELPNAKENSGAWVRLGAKNWHGSVILGYKQGESRFRFGRVGGPDYSASAEVPPGRSGFCLRVRDGKAVLFVGDGQGPPMKLNNVEFDGDNLSIHPSNMPKDGTVRYSQLTIRALSPSEDLEARPTSMPAAPAPSTQPGRGQEPAPK